MRIKLCDSKYSYEVIPDKPLAGKLELMKIKDKMVSEKFAEAVASTPYIIVLKRRGVQFNLCSSGKMIIKADERLAKLIAGEVYNFAGISDGT